MGLFSLKNSFVVVVHNSTLKRVGCKLLYPSPQKRLFTLAALRKSKKKGKSSLDKSHQTKKLPQVHTIPMSNTFRLDKKLQFSRFYMQAINFYAFQHRSHCLLWLPCINQKKGQKSPNEKVTQNTNKVQVF